MKSNKKGLKYSLQLATATALAISTLAFSTSADAQTEAKDAYIQAEEQEAAQFTTYLDTRFQAEMDWAEQVTDNASESVLNVGLEINNLPDFDPQMTSILNSSYLEFLVQQDLDAEQMLMQLDANIAGANITDLVFAIDQNYLIASLPFYDSPLMMSEEGLKRLAEESGESLGDFSFSDLFATEFSVDGLDDEYFNRYNDLVYETLADESFSMETIETEIAGVTHEANVITMQLTEAEIHEVVNVVLEELKNDEVIIDLMLTQVEAQIALEGGNPQDFEAEFVNSIDELQTEFNELNFPEGLTSTIYVVEDTVMKREVYTEIDDSEVGGVPEETLEEDVDTEEDTESEVEDETETEIEEGTEEDVEDGTEDTEVEDGTEDTETDVEDGTDGDTEVEDGTEDDGTEDDSASINSANSDFAAQTSEDDADDETTEEVDEGTDTELEDETETEVEEDTEEDVEEGTEEEVTEEVVEVSEPVIINFVSETAVTETGSETVYTVSDGYSVIEGILSLSETAEGYLDTFTLFADDEELGFVQMDKVNTVEGTSEYVYTISLGPVDERIEMIWEGSANYLADSSEGVDRMTFSIPDVVTHDQLAVVLTSNARLINGVEMIDTTNAEDLSDMSSTELETFFNVELAESFNNWIMNLFMQTNSNQ